MTGPENEYLPPGIVKVLEAYAEELKKQEEQEKKTFVSLWDVRKLIWAIRKEHPYAVPGDRNSYDDFNQGWEDAIDRIDSEIYTLKRQEGQQCLSAENGTE